MKNEELKKWDEELMRKTKTLRDRKVNPELLKGFSMSVERRIASKNEPVQARSIGLRAAVPAFAVIILAFLAVTRLPLGTDQPQTSPVQVLEIAQLPPASSGTESEITEDIETLRELGVWTSEDEKAAGVADDEEELAEVLG